jgi:MFS family permease
MSVDGGTRRGSGGLLAVLLVGQAMATMDGSIVAVAIPTIRATLGASGGEIQLILAGYLLAFAVLVVTGARLGDRYGHGRVFRAGLACFTLASLACGLAPTAVALVLARLAQGAAGALMVPQVVSLIQLHFDGARRARAVALYSMVLALGVAAGQIVGGLMVALDLAGTAWRPAFLLNVPVGAGLLLAGRRLAAAPAGRRAPRLDLVGVAALAAALTAVTVPLVIGRERGWPDWSFPILAAGAAGLLGFQAYERRLAARGGSPLVDPAAVRPAGVRPGLLACFLIMGCYTAYLFALTLHLQGGLGFGPLAAGLTFLPYPAGFATLSLGARWLAEPVRSRLPVAGPLVFGGAIAVLAVLVAGGDRPGAATVPLLYAAGAGHAAGFSPLFTSLLARIEPRYAATVSGMASTGTLLAGVLSVSTLGGVYLAVVGDDPTRSATGLAAVTALVAALLVFGALLARRSLRGLSAGSPARRSGANTVEPIADRRGSHQRDAGRGPVRQDSPRADMAGGGGGR